MSDFLWGLLTGIWIGLMLVWYVMWRYSQRLRMHNEWHTRDQEQLAYYSRVAAQASMYLHSPESETDKDKQLAGEFKDWESPT